MGSRTTSAPKLWWPQLNRRGWHISPFGWIMMIVIPLFWPILALIAVGAVLGLAVLVVVAAVVNVALLSGWAASIAFRSISRTRESPPLSK